jgi:HEAT repeat protein
MHELVHATHPRTCVRAFAAMALGELKDADAREALQEVTKDHALVLTLNGFDTVSDHAEKALKRSRKNL